LLFNPFFYQKSYKLVNIVKTMKTLVIVILVLLVLGLYFYPHITKEAMSVTGNFISDRFVDAKEFFN